MTSYVFIQTTDFNYFYHTTVTKKEKWGFYVKVCMINTNWDIEEDLF